MDVRKDILKKRTREYALRIIKVYDVLPKSGVSRVIGNQVLRCGTSLGAHDAESCRAKSAPDFINKIEGAMQELEETGYWLDLAVDCGAVKETRLKSLKTETTELMSIFVAMVRNTKSRSKA